MFQTTIRSEQENKKNDSNSSSENKPKINFGEMLKGHASVPDLGKQPAQMMVEEEEEKPTQKKAIQKKTMAEEEEELQMKEPPEKKSKSSVTSGTKVSMPDGVKGKMENSFGTDFSNVNIHKDSEQATNMGALAYTQGNDVHFAPGQYNPNTQEGQELLGHELAHVVQQRQGRVKPTKEQGKGLAVNDNPSLENEADFMGARAAQGKDAQVVGVDSGNDIQRKKDNDEDVYGYYKIKEEDKSLDEIAKKIGCSRGELIIANRQLTNFDNPRYRHTFIDKVIIYPNAKRKGVQVSEKGNKTTFHITGKLLNNSHAGINSTLLCEKFKKEFTQAIKNVKAKYGSTESSYEADIDFKVAKSMKEVATTDLLVVLVDDVEYDEWILSMTQTNGVAAHIGARIAYVEAGASNVIDIMIHEVGHLMGMSDTFNRNKDAKNYMSYGKSRSEFNDYQLNRSKRSAKEGDLNLGRNYEYAESNYSSTSETSDNEPFLTDVKKGEKMPLKIENTNLKIIKTLIRGKDTEK